MIDIEKTYKDRIDSIWEKQKKLYPGTAESDIVKLGYVVERIIRKNDVLFIGMNPSFKRGQEFVAGGFYDMSTDNPYFQSLVRFALETLGQSNPCHHDILFVRHSSQKELKSLMKMEAYQSFFEEQLYLSRDIIRAASPSTIVVLNAGARNLFQRLFPFNWETDFDDNLGAYRVMVGKEIPVIFTGMLSGQGTIDLGSRRSLKWQIQRIQKILER